MYVRKVTLTKEEIEYVKSNYEKMTITQMAKELLISHSKLSQNMSLLGIKSSFVSGMRDINQSGFKAEFWTDELHHEYFNY